MISRSTSNDNLAAAATADLQAQSLIEDRLASAGITLRKLEVFRAVAETGSVTRAAEKLAIAQPAVSAHLRDLEARLDTKLVVRRGRNIVLTTAGEHVQQWATDVIVRSLEMQRELRSVTDGSTGTAMLAASMAVGTYVLADLCAAYYVLRPRVRISVQLFNPRLAMEAVRTGSCDFAVLLPDPAQSDQGLVVERLWEERLWLVAAPNTRFARDVIEPEELSHLPFIAPPKGLVARDLEDGSLAPHGIIRRNVILELGHPEPIKRAVLAGIGVAFLFQTAVQEDIAAGKLREIRVNGIDPRQTLFLVYRRRTIFSRAQLHLLNYIRQARPPGTMALPG